MHDKKQEIWGDVNGKKIIIYGIRSGKLLNELYKQGADVYGLHLKTEYIEIARNDCPHLKKKIWCCDNHLNDDWFTAYISASRFCKKDNKKFDIIIFDYFLMYFMHPYISLYACSKFLEKGGQVILFEPHPSDTYMNSFLYSQHPGHISYLFNDYIEKPYFSDDLIKSFFTHTFNDYFHPEVLKELELAYFREVETEGRPDYFVAKFINKKFYSEDDIRKLINK